MLKKLFFLSAFISLLSDLSGQSVITYVGKSTGGTPPMTSVPRLNAQFEAPYGIVFDSKGNLYMSDANTHTISITLKSDNNTVIRVGGYQQAAFLNSSGIASRFNHPSGIAIGPNDEVYVADENNHVIRRISAFTTLGNAQTVTIYAGKHEVKPNTYTSFPGYADGTKDNARFQNPSDVAVDAQGNVYVADKGNNVIRKITTDGTVSTFAGLPGAGGYKDGQALTEAKFNMPSGIFVKGTDIYVADQMNSCIRKISGGQVTTVVSALWTPTDVYLDDVGNYYICDQHRVRKNSDTYAGSTDINQSGYVDDFGTAARFTYVKNIAYYEGGLYVTSINVVRKITDCSNFKAVITKNGFELTATSGKTYIWYKNNNIIFGATSQKYNVTATGDYKVKVIDVNGCVSTSDVLHVDYVGMDEFKAQYFNVYPSIGSSKVYIDLTKSGITGYTVKIYNNLGLLLFDNQFNASRKTEVLNLDDFENGLYFINITSDQISETIKIILVK